MCHIRNVIINVIVVTKYKINLCLYYCMYELVI